MKKKIEVFDYANTIMKQLDKGILLTTKANNKVNTMTIAWGALSIVWAKPIFITYIRENRFTRTQLRTNPEFTINVPIGDYNKKILGICGSNSGRNMDKIKELNLTLEEPEIIAVPAIKEMPLTLECKVIYEKSQSPKDITNDIKKEFYPPEVDSFCCDTNRDFHTVYYGEIVNAYIVE